VEETVVVAKKNKAEKVAGEAVENGEGVTRGRPGRRSVAERKEAVLKLLTGKASIDQLAASYGVLPTTVSAWRDEALAGIEEAMRRGDGASPRERELERQVEDLQEALKEVSLKYALAARGVEAWKATARPTPRRRSPK
jgi:transposase-like protein